jgi:hypothetical protein
VAPIDVRQDAADYSRLTAKGKEILHRLSALGFLALCRHVQVYAPSFAVTALVQALDDLFDGTLDGFRAAPLVTANPVLALFDDVAVPARADHVAGWVRWLYRYDFVILLYQEILAPLTNFACISCCYEPFLKPFGE